MSPPETLSDEEKEGLSPEEIAAIEGADGDEEDGDKEAADAAAKEAADKAADDAAAKEAADKIAEEEAAAAKAAADADAKAAADKDDAASKSDKDDDDDSSSSSDDDDDAGDDAAAASSPQVAQTVVPQVPTVDPKDLADAKDKFDEAEKKFDNGEIEFKEYEAAKDAFKELQITNKNAESFNKASRAAAWENEQIAFYAENEAFKTNRTINTAFVELVNELNKSEEGQQMTDRELLDRAKELVEADLGKIPKGKTSSKAGTDDDASGKSAKAKREAALADAKAKKADRSGIDKDIGDLPSAREDNDVDEFSHLDDLEGEAFQNALDKLTPAQQERYLDRP